MINIVENLEFKRYYDGTTPLTELLFIYQDIKGFRYRHRKKKKKEKENTEIRNHKLQTQKA